MHQPASNVCAVETALIGCAKSRIQIHSELRIRTRIINQLRRTPGRYPTQCWIYRRFPSRGVRRFDSATVIFIPHIPDGSAVHTVTDRRTVLEWRTLTDVWMQMERFVVQILYSILLNNHDEAQ